MKDLIPTEFYLSQNYPNPFKEKTTIKYCVAYKTKVRITIYNSEGEMIEKLVDEVKEAGTYEAEFYSTSGIRYRESDIPTFAKTAVGRQHQVFTSLFCQMKAGDYLSEKEMTLIHEENKGVQPK